MIVISIITTLILKNVYQTTKRMNKIQKILKEYDEQEKQILK